MRKAKVYNHGILAGLLIATEHQKYEFQYEDKYVGPPISLTMPVKKQKFEFDAFPPFFDGVLPEGMLLEALLKKSKIDKNDFLTQLIAVGGDLVGSVTVIGE
jgi:serine/threonine-protein kinase HipA